MVILRAEKCFQNQWLILLFLTLFCPFILVKIIRFYYLHASFYPATTAINQPTHHPNTHQELFIMPHYLLPHTRIKKYLFHCPIPPPLPSVHLVPLCIFNQQR